MVSNSKRILLPFTTLPDDGRFSEDMERAAIFCISENSRSKGEGLILKRPLEQLKFIAGIYYPILLVPWRKKTVLVDGLGFSPNKISFKKIPEINQFLDGVRIYSKTYEAYVEFLSKSLSRFNETLVERVKNIEYLVVDQAFVRDFDKVLTQSKPSKNMGENKVFLVPKISDSALKSVVNDLENLYKSLTSDIESFYEGMASLKLKTDNFVKAVKSEIKKVDKEFESKLKKGKAQVNEKVDKIRRERDKEITRHARRFEKQLYNLHHQRVKLEKMEKRLLEKIEQCKNEIRMSKLEKNEPGEKLWRKEIKKHRLELSKTKEESARGSHEIEVAEEDKNAKMLALTTEYELKVEKGSKELRSLEASRDAKIHMHEQKIKRIKDLTSEIIKHVDRIVKYRKASVQGIDKTVLPRSVGKALGFLPFYLVCYSSEMKNRYVLYPPSEVNKLNISVRLKGFFQKSKVKDIFNRIYPSFTHFFDNLLNTMTENVMFEKKINDAGLKANILLPPLSSSTAKGLKLLKKEGWLDENELQAFTEKLDLETRG